MSVRTSTSRAESRCSGDMYPGEPIAPTVRVRWTFASSAFAMPKSSTFTSGLASIRRVRNRFAGSRARWITPAACASARPTHACSTYSTATAGGRGPAASARCRSLPASSSMTM